MKLAPTAEPAPRAYDLVMFDLDGTLVDTAPEIAVAVNEVLASRRLPPAPETLVRAWIGCGSLTLMRRALAWAGGVDENSIAADVLDEAADLYMQIHEHRSGGRSQPFPGVVACLDALTATGMHLAVVSNKEQQLVEMLLRYHKLLNYFELVVGGDTLPARKPDPLPLRHCLLHFGVARQRALFIGDSALDAQCARAARITCWIVGHGYDSAEAIAAARPDRMISGCEVLTAEL